jgi:hypothetical protein
MYHYRKRCYNGQSVELYSGDVWIEAVGDREEESSAILNEIFCVRIFSGHLPGCYIV